MILKTSQLITVLVFALTCCSGFGQDKPETVEPVSVKNPTPGRPNHSEAHYVLESDQSRGTLELEFEHDRFGNTNGKLAFVNLVVKIPAVPYANTKSTISVWKGGEKLASRKGASRGQILKFKIEPNHFADSKRIALTMKCGGDAAKISENDGEIFLELHTGTPPAPTQTQAPKTSSPSFASKANLLPHSGKEVKVTDNASRILSLLVVPLGGSRYAGLSSKLAISALPIGGGNFATLEFNQDVGESMGGALEEVIRFHRIRHNGWPKDYEMELAFAEKYSPKDGPSAAVATSLLIESIFTGVKLDEKFAVTGDMNASGDVQPIGGVAAKLRGAKSGGAEIIAIPLKNRRRALDLAMVDGINPILESQVFTIESFDQALALASEKKSEKLEIAIALFSEIQRSKIPLNSPVSIQKLNHVIEHAPNHLSARIALLSAQNRFPASLSIIASLEEVDKVLGSLKESAQADLSSTKNVQLSELGEAKSKLRRLRPMLDPRVRDFADAWIEWTGIADQYVTGRVTSKFAVTRLKSAFSKSKAEREKLLKDPSVQEELIQ